MQKHNIEEGMIEGAVDNLTVVNRVNGTDNNDEHPKSFTTTDRDVWDETKELLDRMPVICTLRHVKRHQDDMHHKGYHGLLARDAFWNVVMDRKAEAARLSTPIYQPLYLLLQPWNLFMITNLFTRRLAARLRQLSLIHH